MKHSIRCRYILPSLLLGAFSLAGSLMAQTGKVTVETPSFEDLESPEVGGNTNEKNFKPKDWLEVEVKFKVEMPKNYTQDYIDSITVKWYVAIDNPEGGRKAVYLEKEVKHVNVPVNEDIYSSVYLSPSSIRRISGSDTAGKRVVKSVGGEILVNGQQAFNKNEAVFSSTGKPGWWLELPRYDKIPLRNKNETPFKFLWWDRYAEIEERR